MGLLGIIAVFIILGGSDITFIVPIFLITDVFDLSAKLVIFPLVHNIGSLHFYHISVLVVFIGIGEGIFST